MKKLLSLALLALTACGTVMAGSDSTGTMKWRAVQVTFIPPLGSNGIASWKTGNNCSLNMLVGVNGAVKGADLSGLAGILRADMRGAQLAGLVSAAGGTVTGLQASGLINLGVKRVKGAQVAGLAGVTAGSLRGAQVSGLANVVSGRTTGAQVSGLANVTVGALRGGQISGLVNIASDSATGAQISGLVNVSVGKGRGFQAAGLVNVAAGARVTQVAGLANVAVKMNGVQIGLFNYADTVARGIPVGLLSIVRRGGYRAFELTANESFYVNPAYKIGVRQFYNLFAAGVAYRDSMVIWGWGLGIGTNFPVGKKTDLSIEGLCYQVNLEEWFTHGPNLLNRLSVVLGWHVTPHMALVFAPSWNVTVMDRNNEYGEPVREPWAPYSVYDYEWGNGMVLQMYPGFSFGVRF
jgi:hypothetical protein